jgi:hypothetical protein
LIVTFQMRLQQRLYRLGGFAIRGRLINMHAHHFYHTIEIISPGFSKSYLIASAAAADSSVCFTTRMPSLRSPFKIFQPPLLLSSQPPT